MKNKILAISLLLLLTIVSISSISVSFVQAATSGTGGVHWITSYKIEDDDTGRVLRNVNFDTGANVTPSAITPSENLKITFTVHVLAGGSGDLGLKTGLLELKNIFWEPQGQDYSLGTNFHQNQASTKFNWVTGTFTMVLYGTVIQTHTDAPVNVNIVSINGQDGSIIDQILVQAVSAANDQYQALYDSKVSDLQTLKDNGVASGYIDIFQSTIDQAQALASSGSYTNAIALLNSLDPSNAPPSSTIQMVFIPVIAVLAVIAVLFAVMFMRVRGKVSYFQMVVEDQIKDLEGLTMRAAKVDRSMSASLESVKERLRRLVGM